MAAAKAKSLQFVGNSLKELGKFPEVVKETMGFALEVARLGGKHPDAKPLRGFGGAGVLEIVEAHQGNAYRCVYTVKLEDSVYVLHAFQKKSKSGIATPQADIDLIRSRIARAMEHHEWQKRSRT